MDSVLEQNVREFCGKFYKPNSGTAMGPCHSFDYVDCFMGELDDKLVDMMEEASIDTPILEYFAMTHGIF